MPWLIKDNFLSILHLILGKLYSNFWFFLWVYLEENYKMLHFQFQEYLWLFQTVQHFIFFFNKWFISFEGALSSSILLSMPLEFYGANSRFYWCSCHVQFLSLTLESSCIWNKLVLDITQYRQYNSCLPVVGKSCITTIRHLNKIQKLGKGQSNYWSLSFHFIPLVLNSVIISLNVR